MSDFLAQCQLAILEGDRARARSLAEAALAGGSDVLSVIEGGFSVGVRRAGELFEAGEYFLPELAFSAEAMREAMAVLQPALLQAGHDTARATAVIGTVQGDIHDIGKSLVATMLLANNYRVVDLGCDVANERFVEETRRVAPDLVCLSALLTTTMSAQGEVIRLLESEGLRDKVKVLVGGAPTSAEWARSIGADGHAHNAASAVTAAASLLHP